MSNDDIFRELNLRGADIPSLYNSLGKKPGSSGQGDRVGMHGQLAISRIDDDGTRTLLWKQPNLIMNAGFETMARIWGGPVTPDSFNTLKPGWIAIGDAVAPTVSQKTQLDSFVLARQFDQVTFIGSPTINGCQFEMIVPKSVGGTNIYTEAGLFQSKASSGGINFTSGMIAYQVYPGIPKNNSFQLAFHWIFQFTAA